VRVRLFPCQRVNEANHDVNMVVRRVGVLDDVGLITLLDAKPRRFKRLPDRAFHLGRSRPLDLRP